MGREEEEEEIMADKWVTVNGKHVQVKDGKLSLKSKSKTAKTDGKKKVEITKQKIDETNKFKQKEKKVKK